MARTESFSRSIAASTGRSSVENVVTYDATDAVTDSSHDAVTDAVPDCTYAMLSQHYYGLGFPALPLVLATEQTADDSGTWFGSPKISSIGAHSQLAAPPAPTCGLCLVYNSCVRIHSWSPLLTVGVECRLRTQLLSCLPALRREYSPISPSRLLTRATVLITHRMDTRRTVEPNSNTLINTW